ncbi:hypothetical protein [Streptomyces sp. NPDC001744]|uniref:hypothetical protein n=1 Tax=Streptomyces sp. NPDC001744 TaxID=3364606 RepID=UPI0036B2B5C3
MSIERDLITRLDALLDDLRPAGIAQSYALWHLGTALPEEPNTEIILPIVWDLEISVRVKLDSRRKFTVGWGGELGEPDLFTSSEIQDAHVEEMIEAVNEELAREIHLTERRVLFGGPTEFHIKTPSGWVDISRGGIRSQERRVNRARRKLTLLA